MNKGIKWIVLLLACLLLAGCGNSYTKTIETAKKELDTGFIPARAGMYDSADTAVIKDINKAKNTITFFNLVRERSYTLNFDGTTGLYDKYGSAVSLEQMAEGDIVDILFLKSKKMLASMQKSESSFTLDGITKFRLDEKAREFTVGDDTYRITDELLVFSKGNQVETMDINQVDTLKIQGIDRTIYSITVEKGHGYLRLKNDEYFWGGWIEVGQEIIRPIEEGMLLVVPEGKYDVLLSAKGISGTRTVSVKRDKETELDLGDLKKESVKKFGTLIIAVFPDTADVYIDGLPVDISVPVEAEYGIHQLMAKAEGYQTVTKYIKVGQESATIEVVMEKETEETVSGNETSSSVSDNDVASATGGKLTIDAPSDVEVYLDGSYIGITPVAFTKTVGIHVITLRATGYETKSYTINIENADTNESMSFSDLVKEDEDDKEKEGDDDNEQGSVSDNSSDGGKNETKEEETSKEPETEEENTTVVEENIDTEEENTDVVDDNNAEENVVSAMDTEQESISEKDIE